MSRYYEFSIGITGVEQKDEDDLIAILNEELADCDFDFNSGIATFSGNVYLCSGESEEEAHNRISAAIKARFPDAKVGSRWTNLEELPCNEYGELKGRF